MKRSGVATAVIGIIVAVVALPFIIPGMLTAILVAFGIMSIQQRSCNPESNGSVLTIAAAPYKAAKIPGLKPDQIKNAGLIIGIGKSRGESPKYVLTAVQTSYQESRLRNLRYGDRDSLGLYQQRAGWGSRNQRLNPTYAINKFYDALDDVSGRKSMSPYQIALAVQRPSVAAYNSPQNRFTDWDGLARKLMGNYAPNDTTTAPQELASDGSEQCASQDGQGSAQQVEVFIQKALSQLGVPYKFGAESKEVAFDCSGLTQWAAKEAGIKLPRVAAAQQHIGTPVDRAHLQRGDLVFWGNPAHHVGIYLGNGKLLSAPHTGAVVRISNMYYNGFSGGRRIVKATTVASTNSGDWQSPMKRGTYSPTGKGGQYGPRIHPVTHKPGFHNGVDLAAPTGTPLYVAHSGKVVARGFDSCWGNYVAIEGGGVIVLYPHQSSIDSAMRVGQTVSAGQREGSVGGTGCVTGPHLHLSVCTDLRLCLQGSGAHGRGSVNPLTFFRSKGISLFGSSDA